MDTTKAQRKSFVEQVICEIEAGNVNPLLIHCQVKSMESLINTFLDEKVGDDLKKRYAALLLEEAQKHEKKFEYHNALFEVRESGVKYDWSKCGDAALLDQMAEHKQLTEAIKERQEFLKGLKGAYDLVDEDTGEVLATFYPPAKTSTTTVTVTLK